MTSLQVDNILDENFYQFRDSCLEYIRRDEKNKTALEVNGLKFSIYQKEDRLFIEEDEVKVGSIPIIDLKLILDKSNESIRYILCILYTHQILHIKWDEYE